MSIVQMTVGLQSILRKWKFGYVNPTIVLPPSHGWEGEIEDLTRGYWLAPWTTIGDVFFGEVSPDSFPLFVCETQCHAR